VLEKSLKVLEFSFKNSRPLKVLENRHSLWKCLKSPRIFSNRFCKLHMYRHNPKLLSPDTFRGVTVPQKCITALCQSHWQFMMADDLLFNIAVLVGGYWVFPVCCLPYGTDFCETVLCHTDNFGVGKAWWKSLNVLEFWVWNGVWTLLITLCIISTLSEITVKCYTLTGISVYKLYIMKTIVHSRCLCLVCNVQDTFTCLWMTGEGKSCTWLHVLQYCTVSEYITLMVVSVICSWVEFVYRWEGVHWLWTFGLGCIFCS